MTARRFPPPWTLDEANDACFIVRDHNGQALAYVYFEDEPGRRSAAHLLSKDEARRIAPNIAKLPVLIVVLQRGPLFLGEILPAERLRFVASDSKARQALSVERGAARGRACPGVDPPSDE